MSTDLVTDAIPSEALLSTCASEINIPILQMIEHELDDRERLSILFLMLDNHNCFDEVLIAFESKQTTNIISKFVSKINDWQEKFLEALCVVNNVQVLNNLGLNMNDLRLTFLPGCPRISHKIHTGAKILYSLFEQFDGKTTKEFLNSMNKDIPVNVKINELNFLELHALYWISTGKISIQPGLVDLKILLKHLKSHGFFDSSVYHDIQDYSNNRLEKAMIGEIDVMKNNENNCQYNGVPKEINNVKKYHTIERGLCVIINQVEFPGTVYETRLSSDIDASNLERTFKGLHFDVKHYRNKNKSETEKILRNYSLSNTENYDCFVICILSHGLLGTFITTDGQEVSLNYVEKEMCSSAYRNAIKILILQACQGKNIALVEDKMNLTTDGLSAMVNCQDDTIMENYQNFFQFRATMDHYLSIRHRIEGSWFIQELCKSLRRPSTDGERLTIDEWSKEVKRNVQKRRGCLNNKKVAQLSQTIDRLTITVFFPFYRELDNN